ncbi:hypothetical protein KZ483_06550 [Paenibacillus sp. sptzw28]|uniref:hypothetical protein n=1 Tax=Paenibacillus sp. sptzw28 TaxID=715179 RepID=UPI001C6DE73B|nr:hypothetical protein [Paenibacillus sp. sptzw28]QYR22616.1 hypothetical protein KZ483_06550 [Paenibacillus sp. sptzw28]
MMNWRGANILFQHEMRRSWLGLLLTMLFFTYMSIVTMPLFTMVLQGEDGGWAGDFVYLSVLPSMSFLMNRSLLKYWLNDPYTRKLAYWRTMPIGLTSIVLARMMQLVTVLVIVGIFFFTAQYLMLNELRELLSPGEYVYFALTWLGYSLAIGSTYVYFEQAINGKLYLIICIGYLILFGISVLVFWTADVQLLKSSIEAAQRHNVMWPAGALTLGAAVMIFTGIVLRKRLATRNLLS